MNKLKKLIASNWTRLKVMLIIRLCLNQKTKEKKSNTEESFIYSVCKIFQKTKILLHY